MARTKGQGNPNWTREETILALDLYIDLKGKIPVKTHPQILQLSELLRASPAHNENVKKPSFRNPDGIVFKLQNLRKLASGQGLSNLSKMDRTIWNEFKNSPYQLKNAATTIRNQLQSIMNLNEEAPNYTLFPEGKFFTEVHRKRERDAKLRTFVLKQKRQNNQLHCEICNSSPKVGLKNIADAMFEIHHIIPLSFGKERQTKVSDVALLCANCHRMLHRAITLKKKWISIEEAKKLFG